jgi:hypothetical protein
MMHGYKLFRLRRDGTLGPLFIGRCIVLEVGKWMRAKAIPTKGYSFRPGWHACSKRSAPHLSKKGRVWCKVSLKGVTKHLRPACQGGLWYTAKWIRVDEVLRGC